MRMLEVHAWRIVQRGLHYGKRRAAFFVGRKKEYQKEMQNIEDK